jgi:hypothetical protein
MTTTFVPPREARRILSLSARALLDLETRGQIDCLILPSGHRRYDVESFIGKHRKQAVAPAPTSS